MSIFHNTISKAIAYLTNPTEENAKKANVIINEHLADIGGEVKRTGKLRELLDEYDDNLSVAGSNIRSGDYKNAIIKMKKAHNLILDIEIETRKILGDEHRFLE